MSSPSYFTYEPLPADWIRLLRIHSPSSSDSLDEELEITLIPVPISECSKYVALSYTWGAPSAFIDPTTTVFTTVPRCFPVKCAGKLVLATRNLRDALRRLRQGQNTRLPTSPERGLGNAFDVATSCPVESTLLWIDALCINQNDLEERANQVVRMRDIYRKAQYAIAWWGEMDMTVKSNFAIVDKICAMGRSSTPLSLGAFTNEELVAFASIMTRTWFLEIVGPSRSDTGAKDIRVMWYKLRSLVYTQLAAIERHSFDLGTIATDALGLPNTGQILYYITNSNPGYAPDFMSVMFMSGNCKVFDPRDRIYAILGITSEFISDKGTVIEPDYTKDVRNVYIEAAMAVIRRRRDLAILSIAHMNTNVGGLPSWCPDYNFSNLPDHAARSPILNFADKKRRWSLGDSWSSASNISVIDGLILRADGLRYDIVLQNTLVCHQVQHASGASGGGLHAMYSLISELRLPLRNRHEQTRVEMLWRTLMLDTFEAECPAPMTAGLFFPAMAVALLSWISDQDCMNSELESLAVSVARLTREEPTAAPFLPHMARLRNFMDFPHERQVATEKIIAYEIAEIRTKKRALGMSTTEDIFRSEGDDGEHLSKQFLRNTYGDLESHLSARKLFRTKRETLGLGNILTQDTDEIWFLRGAYAPVILRPLPNGNYRFIGEAYVYGIMHGEAEFSCGSSAPIMIE